MAQTSSDMSDDNANAVSADRRVAWLLVTELRTRITTQALPYQHGDEQAALDSIYAFFKVAREALANHPGSTSVFELVVPTLNRTIRPFTAKWHRVATQGRLESTDLRYEFRAELDALRRHLYKLSEELAPIAGLESFPETWTNQTPLRGPDPSFKFGTRFHTNLPAYSLRRMDALERRDVQTRRTYYGLTQAEEGHDGIGLAISGGGIRSTAFSLGITQALVRHDMFKHIDFVSTVSGGAYLAGFIATSAERSRASVGNLDYPPPTQASDAPGFGTRRIDQPFAPATPASPENNASASGEPMLVRHLRNHSKFLSKGGIRAYLHFFVALMFGVWVSALMLAPFLMLLAWGLYLAFPCFQDVNESCKDALASDIWQRTFLASVGVGVLGLLCYAWSRNRRRLGFYAAWVGSASLVALLLASSWLIPSLHQMLSADWLSISLLAAVPSWVGLLMANMLNKSRLGKLAAPLTALLFPLLVIVALLLLLDLKIELNTGDYAFGNWFYLAIILATLLFSLMVVDLNFATLHNFYRERLSQTFLVRASGLHNDAHVVHDEDARLSRLTQERTPVLLINASLNVPASERIDLRGRNCDCFMFSKHYCGSRLTGWHRTRLWEHADKNLDLSTAIAISGGAVSPHMGRLTSHRYSVLMSLFNVRLSYWVRRPDSHLVGRIRRLLANAPIRYFFKEMTGSMSEKDSSFNVSDGAHVEVLGAYELLRRRCRYIVVIDAELDPQYQFDGITNLIRMAQLDLGVTINISLRDLEPGDNRYSACHFVMASIEYPAIDESGPGHGLLLYIKPTLTGNESEALLRYHRNHADFPHISTGQQLYDEARWEAVRALGEHTGNDMFAEHWVGQQPPKDFQDWFLRLRDRLL